MPLTFGNLLANNVDGATVGLSAADTPFPAAAGVFTLVSTSAEDNPGGGGVGTVNAEVIVDHGAGDCRIHKENVATDGLTPVSAFVGLGLGVLRIRKLIHVAAGDRDIPQPAGDIIASIGGTPAGRIVAGNGVSETCVFAVGSERRELLEWVAGSVFFSTAGQDDAKKARVQLQTRLPGAGWTNAGNPLPLSIVQSSLEQTFPTPFEMQPCTDVRVIVINPQGVVIDVYAGFNII